MALLIAAATAVDATAAAIDMKVVIRSDTGQVWLYNSGIAPVGIVYYSVSSASGALVPAEWASIAANYDVSGDGSVDPTNEWSELSDTTSALSEGTFFDPAGTLAADQSVSLGAIWNPAAGLSDLSAQMVEAGQSTPTAMSVVLAGDFDLDRDVDLTDLGIWQASFLAGTGSSHADGDANLDGNVDGADFLLWQGNAAYQSAVSAGGATATGAVTLSATVPEPGAAWLLCIGTAGLVVLVWRVGGWSYAGLPSQLSRRSTAC